MGLSEDQVVLQPSLCSSTHLLVAGCFLYTVKLDREEGDTSVYQALECLPMGKWGP